MKTASVISSSKDKKLSFFAAQVRLPKPLQQLNQEHSTQTVKPCWKSFTRATWAPNSKPYVESEKNGLGKQVGDHLARSAGDQASLYAA